MAVLVTGGTGFVGTHLVRRLMANGERVRCLVRSPGKARDLDSLGVELVPGDVTRAESLPPAFEGVEAVFHLVAIIREEAGQTFREVNVQGTRNIVEAAQRAGVKRFIHMGILGVRSDPKYRYPYSKWLGEEAVRQSSLNYTIFRPSVIFGDGFSFLDRIVQSINLTPPIAPLPGCGKTRFQPIWVEDLVTCLLAALKDEKTWGQAYEIGGPEHLTYEEITDAVIATLDVRRVKVHIPVLLLAPGVWVMERIFWNPPATSDELTQLDVDNITNLDSVEQHFGFKPRPLREVISYLRKRYRKD